jgi:hypothetical protein
MSDTLVYAPSEESGWVPVVTLDLMNATQTIFDEKMREFYRATRERPLPRNLLTTGWHTITPEIAETLLLGKANRKISLAHVQYLARQMLSNNWMQTGQPIILTADGIMRDAYHRCCACYFSGASFPSFVVAEVPQNDYLFAFIDNCKPRSAADGLRTAGLNGLSATVAAVVKIAVRHATGYYEPHSKVRIPKMTPIELIQFVQKNPTMHDAVGDLTGEYKEVLQELLPHKKDVACYFAWKAREIYGEDAIDGFFGDLGDEDSGGPIALLRSKLMLDAECRGKLKDRDVLAFLIKAFNAWRSDKPMRRLILGTDEMMPKFDAPDPETEIFVAAERARYEAEQRPLI